MLSDSDLPATCSAAQICLLLQEIQIGFGFTFLVPAHPGSPGQNPKSRKMVVVVVVVVVLLSLSLNFTKIGHIPGFSQRLNGGYRYVLVMVPVVSHNRCNRVFVLQCFDAVGWVAGRASGL